MIPGTPEPHLDHLYQEVILDHNRRPRNFKEIPNPTCHSQGLNPLCGDNYRLFLNVDANGLIQDVGFTGSGCAISKASGSIMTSEIKGKGTAHAAKLKEDFLALMTQEEVPDATKENVGRLAMFEGVKEFPIRVKCATLIWHALADALKSLSRHEEKA